MPIFGKKIEDMSEKELYDKGSEYHSKEKWDKASEHLGRLIETAPEHTKAREMLAESLFYQTRSNESLKHYDLLLEAHPENSNYLGMRGLCLVAEGRKDEAIQEIERALDIENDETLRGFLVKMKYKPVKILDITGFGKDFISDMGHGMVALQPTQYLQKLADICTEKKALVKVQQVCVEGRFNIKDLKDHLEMIEGNSGIRGMFAYFDGVSVLEFEKIHDGILQYHATAENLRKEGKFDEAAEIAKKAIFFGSKMGSEHGRKSTAKSWRILGDTYGFQTPPDYAQAEEAYKKGLELVSDDYESLSRLLYMYRIQKRYDDCKSLLDNMPEFTRGIVNVKIEDISIAVDIGEYDRAEQLSKELTERYSENTFSWVMLAHTYLKWERWEESIEASRKAISINEKEAVSYANLAEAFIGLGNMEDADAALEKGFEIEKEYGTLWYLKSQILTATGREAEAKDAMEKAEKFGYED